MTIINYIYCTILFPLTHTEQCLEKRPLLTVKGPFATVNKSRKSFNIVEIIRKKREEIEMNASVLTSSPDDLELNIFRL